MFRLGGKREYAFPEVERTWRTDVDSSSETAVIKIRSWRLVDLERAYELGRKRGKVKGARESCEEVVQGIRNAPPVQRYEGERVGQPADVHTAALAASSIDLDAADALH